MKKIIAISLMLALLLPVSAFAFSCEMSQAAGGGEQCWATVTVASNETSLVSAGTVLVFDIANAQGTAAVASYTTRVSTASAQGIYVAGVAQKRIASGAEGLVLVRGKGTLAINSTSVIASGDALFVGVSGDATHITSTTQGQLGFALGRQATATATPARSTTDAYITIV